MELSELISWTSASGLARSLYVNKSWGKGCLGAFARVLIVLLLIIPLALGLTEISLGIVYRSSPEGCPYPLPMWVIVDGCAALLTAVLGLVDIARVQALSDPAGDDDDEEADDTPAARARRQKVLGTYACTGLTVIFLLPLFRLIWLMIGLEGLYQIDPASFSSGTTFFSGPLNPGSCNPTLYTFAHYYIETATLIVLLMLVLLLFAVALILCATAQSISLGWCCSWCCCDKGKTKKPSSEGTKKGGRDDDEGDEEQLLLKKQNLSTGIASDGGSSITKR